MNAPIFPQSYPEPQPLTDTGAYVRLEPLTLDHAEDLFAVSAGRHEAFRYLPDYPPPELQDVTEWISAENKKHPLVSTMYAVIDVATGKALGRESLMRVDPKNGVAEIGNIFWGDGLAGTSGATEAFFLMADYVFSDLGYRRFEWKLNNENQPSHRAAQRFGFSFEGVFRQHQIVKGKNRDTAWYSIIDAEWPELREEFQRWLAAENFDENGHQLSSLNALEFAGKARN